MNLWGDEMLPGDGPFPERNMRLYQKQSLGEKARPSPVGSQRRGWRGKQTLSILVGRLYMLSWFLLGISRRTDKHPSLPSLFSTPPSRPSQHQAEPPCHAAASPSWLCNTRKGLYLKPLSFVPLSPSPVCPQVRAPHLRLHSCPAHGRSSTTF